MAQSGPKLSVAETSAICPIADLSTRCPWSNIYGRQSQFSVVADTRNQRYLHPRSVGAGVPICEVDQGCQLAIKLNLKLPTIWHAPDLFDEFTDALRSFQA